MLSAVTYQLSWKILPGLRGLSCSNFSAVPTTQPDNPAVRDGVVVDFAGEAECEAFLRQLEEHFAAQRFSNNAAAFEAVKTYVLDWAGRKA